MTGAMFIAECLMPFFKVGAFARDGILNFWIEFTIWFVWCPTLTLYLLKAISRSTFDLPAVLHASNEIAVAAFLARRISFPRIWQTVEEVMNRHSLVAQPTLDAILRADQWARAEAGEMLKH